MLVDHLLKTNEESKNLKKQEKQSYIYKNKLDKACFQHDMAYENSKDLARRTTFDKAFNFTKTCKYDGYQ